MNVVKPDNESQFKFFLKNVAAAAIAGCSGEIATIPFDTAKVIKQVEAK